MSSHSELSPSSSDRWLTCPASVPHNRDVEDTGSDAAREGTAAHMLAEQAYLDGRGSADHHLGDSIEVEPDDPEQPVAVFVVNKEMVFGVNKWLGELKAILDDNPEAVALIEQKLDLSSVIRPGESGTSDAVIPTAKVLHVFDFKYGYDVVLATRPQLKLYALGALDALGWGYEFDEVHTHIVQPRASNYDTARFTVDQLEDFRKYVHSRVALIDTDDAPYQYSEHGCKYCAIKESCEARARGAMEDVANVFPVASLDCTSSVPPGEVTDVEPIPAASLSNDQLAHVLTVRKAVESLFDDCASEALRRSKSGEKIPGFKVVTGKGSRSWADEEAVEQEFKRKKVRVDDFAPRSLISPAQAEKLLPGKKGKWLSEFITKSDGQPRLAPLSARGTPIEFSKPEDIFPDGTDADGKGGTPPPSIFDNPNETETNEDPTYEWE